MRPFLSCFSSFWGKLIWKMCPLVLSEILEVFLNILTQMTSILFKVLRICNSQFKCNYLKNQKLFLNFLFYLWNLHQILNILKKNMMVIANVLPKSQTVDILVRPLSKKRRFRTRCDIQHVKSSQILAKSPWEQFYLVFSSFSRKLIWKMSPLLSDEILKVFVYILTGDGQYPVQGFIEFATPNWNAIIWKRKNFSSIFFFFLHFWNLHHILNILKEKLIVIVNVFPKLQNVRIFVRKLS